MPCCDVCDPSLIPAAPAGPGVGGVARARPREGRRRRWRGRRGPPAGGGALDAAIVEVVSAAKPGVGRTRTVEILRGGRSKVIQKYAYDGLPPYGSFAHLSRDEVLTAVDELITAGRLRSTGGAYPKLAASMSGLRVGVLASGAGTNLQAILDAVHGRDGIEVVGVLSDRPDAAALARAAAAGVETGVFGLGREEGGFGDDRAARDAAMAAWLADRGVGLVVLAGYMQLLDPGFLDRFGAAVINVHPALLPAFPGLDAIGQALAYGVRVFGVTVHFVDEGVDSGPVILQGSVELPQARTPEQVHDALRPLEHALLPEAIRLIAAGRLSFDPGNPRRVVIAPPA